MNRIVSAYLAFSAVAITVLIVVVVILAFRINAAVTVNKNNAAASCRQSNVNRLEDIAIWHRVLNTRPSSAAARAEIADLQHLVDIKDTPRVC